MNARIKLTAVLLSPDLVARLEALRFPNEDGHPTLNEYVVAMLKAAALDIEEIEPLEISGVAIKIVSDPTLPADEMHFIPKHGETYIARLGVEGRSLVSYNTEDGTRTVYDVNEDGIVTGKEDS